jgi:hypothetical protein
VSGVLPILHLLSNDTGVQAIVTSASRIVPGDLPIGLALPAITVEQVDGVPRNTISMLEPNRVWTDRISVWGHVRTPSAQAPGLGYPGLAALMAAIVAACPNQRGTIAGIYVLSILPQMRGPYMQLADVAGVSQSQDFMVAWRT